MADDRAGGEAPAVTDAPTRRTGAGAMRENRVVQMLARRRVALGFLVGAATLLLARPTWTTWRWGLAIAIVGEGVRIWAAGHLEKGREVTRSGPYRVTRHPLYAGSATIAAGAAVASGSVIVALLAAVYMGVTIAAAVRSEEAELRRAFGPAYDEYRASRSPPMPRRFSVSRALRNREHRAVAGLAAGFLLLALKMVVFPGL